MYTASFSQILAIIIIFTVMVIGWQQTDNIAIRFLIFGLGVFMYAMIA